MDEVLRQNKSHFFGNIQTERSFAGIVTARKLSLGQGNVLTRVCHSVHRWGVGFPACITGHMTRGLHPGGWADPP